MTESFLTHLGSTVSKENGKPRSKLSTAHRRDKGKSCPGLSKKHDRISSSETAKIFIKSPGRNETVLSPTTVIPETPECLMNNSCKTQERKFFPSSQASPICIADTPPTVIHDKVTKETDKNEIDLEHFPEPNLLHSKRSKLSRKLNRQLKASKVLTNEAITDRQEDDFVIKPTVTFGKKHASSKKKVANPKRSPDRGNSPFSKRTQVFVGGHNMKTRVRKHLFDSLEKDTIVSENFAVRQVLSTTESDEALSIVVEDKLLNSRKTPSSVLPWKLTNERQEEHYSFSKSEGQNLQDGKENNLLGEAEAIPDQLVETSTHGRIIKFENISCKSDKHVLVDRTNHEMSQGRKETVSSLLDKSVEWDDELNESLLAALDEDSLDEDFHPSSKSSSKGLSAEEEKLVPTFAKLSPFKRPQDGPEPLPPNLKRFVVKGVHEKDSGEKVLQLKNLTTLDNQVCVVQGVWSEIPYCEGDLLAIHGDLTSQGECVISQNDGFVVYNPDLLLTGTAVANSIRCMRRSVFDGYFKGIDKGNKAMVLGTLVHEVFDRSLRKRKFDDSSLKKFAADSVQSPSFRDKLYSMQMKESVILQDIEEYYKPLQLWAKKYLQPTPNPHAVVDIKWPESKISEKFQVSLPKIQDIEDNFWSPRWGLKGKVDVTTQVKIHKRDQPMRNKSYTLPLELKTGRQTNSIEHHGQLVLYNLMMADLDSKVPPLGLLLYLKTGAMLSVTASHMDKRELLHLRNQLAYFMSKTVVQGQADDGKVSLKAPEMPPPIQDDFTCKKCAHLTSCAMFNRLNPAPLSQSAQEMFDEQISHLRSSHLEYFVHWYKLCLLEHTETKRKNSMKDVWNKPIHEREKKGTCCGDLIVKESKTKDMVDFEITFSKKDGSSSVKFSPGDWLIVSQENQKIAKLIGTAKSVNGNTITISTDSSLPTYAQSPVMYYLDKNDSYDSLASSFVNIACLMSQTAHKSNLRELIIDLGSPSFDSPATPLSLCSEAEKILKSLNGDQRKAILKVLHCNDYSLILGMPGTGKTTTVTSLVRILVLQGKSVLLTSYTHSAVDNILLKLRKHGVSFLRLGSSYRIHQNLQQFSEEVALKGLSVDDISNIIDTMPVIAATSLGVKSALLAHKHFDYCIIDEASQISQPVCLAPLFKSSKFVLVGDHKQLPPLVQSGLARNNGMDESLFQRLATSHPEAVSDLRLQYRMHPLIMDLSNAFMYEGFLQCGNHAEQSSFLTLPNLNANMITSTWCQKAVLPETVVQFFSTEKLSGDDNSENGLNETEASLVKDTVKLLIQCGCSPGEIGVITPFRKQCHLLQTMVAVLSKDIEINTIDKYQGRDKSVIVISFTLHKQEGASILDDARRLNVALTRAKKKLIMFGNGKALRQSVTLSKLLGILENKQWITLLEDEHW
ncbi:DNA replication ATP-dependent helicase/nuclease DNA2 [Holothuria leucospilota]|uniref:DNA replication ATP-dependent helicase/nuclease n=1 Tax=Holothuria leucospilota TaxID=206669 RepID=A0A9Q0YBT6_HOLLE|nr:DNA replication ATP-dependent helicase/nuclease DNA2 [Holothuria leucospilota]